MQKISLLKFRKDCWDLPSRQCSRLARDSRVQVTTSTDWSRELASAATVKGRRMRGTRLARRLARHFQSVASPVRWNVVAFAFRWRSPRVFHSSASVVVRATVSPSIGSESRVDRFVRAEYVARRDFTFGVTSVLLAEWRREMRRRTAVGTAPTRRDARSAI